MTICKSTPFCTILCRLLHRTRHLHFSFQQKYIRYTAFLNVKWRQIRIYFKHLNINHLMFIVNTCASFITFSCWCFFYYSVSFEAAIKMPCTKNILQQIVLSFQMKWQFFCFIFGFWIFPSSYSSCFVSFSFYDSLFKFKFCKYHSLYNWSLVWRNVLRMQHPLNFFPCSTRYQLHILCLPCYGLEASHLNQK